MARRRINRFQGTTSNFSYRLRSLKKTVDSLRKGKFNEWLGDIVKGYESRIVEMIQTQMWNGKNGAEMGGQYGDIIRPFYRPSTIKRKMRKGQPYDRVTLYDKGNFYRRMRIYYNKREGFFVKSTDSKNDRLVKKYGEEIFRLDHYNFNQLVSIIKMEMLKKVKQELLGKR